LLYFVSNALEVDLRTPILGMDNVYKEDYTGWDGSSSTADTLKDWRRAVAQAGLQRGGRLQVLDADKITTALQPDGKTPLQQVPASHGGFDNNVDLVGSTLGLVVHGALLQPVDDLRGF